MSIRPHPVRRISRDPRTHDLMYFRAKHLFGSVLFVRPAWAHSCGCKSRRKQVTASEAKRSCMRATECGEEAWSEAAGR